MTSLTVDDVIKARVQPGLQPVVAMIRGLMKECAPEAQEIISYGIPAYRVRRIVAVISPTKQDITFSFSRGAEFEDRYGLLGGTGHKSKFVKMKSVASANQEALRYYIKQALEIEAA